MRKYLFMSMLAMAVGGHFLASADVANAAKQKAKQLIVSKTTGDTYDACNN